MTVVKVHYFGFAQLAHAKGAVHANAHMYGVRGIRIPIGRCAPRHVAKAHRNRGCLAALQRIRIATCHLEDREIRTGRALQHPLGRGRVRAHGYLNAVDRYRLIAHRTEEQGVASLTHVFLGQHHLTILARHKVRAV